MNQQDLTLKDGDPVFARWTGAPWADVYAHSYGNVALDFASRVVGPALTSLDERLDRLRNSKNDLDAFDISNAETLLSATTTAFVLSFQSIWERQLRTYLLGSAKELGVAPELAARAEARKWPIVIDLFRTLRKHPIEQFEAYQELAFLHGLANVCRHGDGPSVHLLAISHRELWPDVPAGLSDLPGYVAQPLRAANMRIPPGKLFDFSSAIEAFWDEVRYLYDEGISPKHGALAQSLVLERAERAERRRSRGLSPWFR